MTFFPVIGTCLSYDKLDNNVLTIPLSLAKVINKLLRGSIYFLSLHFFAQYIYF